MWYGVVYAPVDDEIDEHDGHAGVRQHLHIHIHRENTPCLLLRKGVLEHVEKGENTPCWLLRKGVLEYYIEKDYCSQGVLEHIEKDYCAIVLYFTSFDTSNLQLQCH